MSNGDELDVHATTAYFDYFLFIGTYTLGWEDGISVDANRKGCGIYCASFDSTSGNLHLMGCHTVEALNGNENPSFLAVSENERYMYVAHELEDSKMGGLSALNIDVATGALQTLNSISSKSHGPCQVACNKDCSLLLAANYAGGAVSVAKIDSSTMHLLQDDEDTDKCYLIQHIGSSVNEERQQAPHCHCVSFCPSGRFALVADLGTDEVTSYSVTVDSTLNSNATSVMKINPGFGPRVLEWHPAGRVLYVLCELSGRVCVYDFDDETGQLTDTHHGGYSCIPADRVDSSSPWSADIHIDTSGRFLYVSNRGEHEIAVFSVSSNGKVLTLISNVPLPGKTPRNFCIDPSGRHLLVACQESGCVYVYRVNPDSGLLVYAENMTMNVPYPVCLKFVKAMQN